MELLTEECKKYFEDWFMAYILGYNYEEIPSHRATEMQLFYSYPFEYQSGVYLAFFETIGIWIGKANIEDIWWYETSEKYGDDQYNYREGKEHGLKQAIKKANEIYNNSSE